MIAFRAQPLLLLVVVTVLLLFGPVSAAASDTSSTCDDTSPPWTQGVCVSNAGGESVECARECLAGPRWDALRASLGTAAARERRRQQGSPPVVRNPPWLTGSLLSSAFRILAKEILGYDKIHTMSSSSRTGLREAAEERCRAVTLESWRVDGVMEQQHAEVAVASSASSTAVVADRNTVLSAPLGAVGSEGLYVPEYTPPVSTHYKNLRTDKAALGRFPRDGSEPLDSSGNLTQYFPAGEPWGCDAQAVNWTESLCVHGRWYATNCGEGYPSDSCVEMYLPLQQWSNGWWEAVVENNGLNFSVVYTTYGGQVDTVRRAFDEARDIVYYWWSPDPLTETFPSQRLTLPLYSTECASRYAADPLLSGVDCQLEDIALQKLMNSATAASEPDLYALWSNFEVSTAELRRLMSFHASAGGEHHTMDAAACAWLNSEGSTPDWAAWLEISDPCVTASSGEVWDAESQACVPAVVAVEEEKGEGRPSTILIILSICLFILTLLFGLAICVAIFRALRSRPSRLSKSQPPGLGPSKTVTLVITDIQGSTSLWDAHPAEMSRGVSLHHRILRATLRDCDGYEVATEGDSFKCAFHTPEDAICWAVLVQLQLLSAPWDLVLEDGGWREFGDGDNWADVNRPKDKRNEVVSAKQLRDGMMQEMDSSDLTPHKLLFGTKLAATTSYSRRAIRKNPQLGVRHASYKSAIIPAFRGLRVRIGIHTGTASVVGRHENTRRVTYGGRVAAVAKAVADVPCGGQIIASGDTIAAIGSMDGLMVQVNRLCFGWQSSEDPEESVVPAKLTVVHLGSHIIKGMSEDSKRRPMVAMSGPQSGTQTSTGRFVGDEMVSACSYTFGALGDGASRLSGDTRWSVRDKGQGKRSSEYTKIASKGGMDHSQFPPLKPMTSSSEESELKGLPDLDTYAEQLRRSQELVEIIPWPLRGRYWCNPRPATTQVSPGFADAPPANGVTIMFIFIDGWEDVKLWGEAQQSRAELIAQSRRLFELQVRASLVPYNGYEVEGEDGCFVCAFHSAVEGVEFAVALQACMTETPWSPELLAHPACSPVLSGAEKEVLRGPRLKIGLCTADAVQAQPSIRTGRMEYFGWVMNHAARVAAIANGGQILFHERTRQHLDINSLHQSIVVKYCGRHRMKGIGKSVNVYQACGPQLWEYSFPALDTKGADKALQPMLEYLTITGADRRRSSITRMSWTSLPCGASVQAEVDADEEEGRIGEVLKQMIAISRRSAGMHRHLSNDGLTNPERGRPKRNSIDCSFRRPTELQIDLESVMPPVGRTNSDSTPLTRSEQMIAEIMLSDAPGEVMAAKSLPAIAAFDADELLPWQQEDPSFPKLSDEQADFHAGLGLHSSATALPVGGLNRSLSSKVTFRDYSRLSMGSVISPQEAAEMEQREEARREAMATACGKAERTATDPESNRVLSLQAVYNNSFYTLPSPVSRGNLASQELELESAD